MHHTRPLLVAGALVLDVGIGGTIAHHPGDTNRHRHPARRPAANPHDSTRRPADLVPTEEA